MNIRKPLIVSAVWDDEAEVWVAMSDDVPGLVTEAEDIDKLMLKLNVMIPELLEANGFPDADEYPFELHSKISAIAHRRAA